MEDYKPNSYKSKEAPKQTSEKRLQKVVSGTTRTKKKSSTHKLADIFIAKDVSDVKSYVVMDVIIPAIKDLVYDIVTNGVDMILFNGERRSGKKRNSASKISYGSYYRSSEDRDRRDSRRTTHNGFDYDDIIFDNRGDAVAVLTAMEDVIDQFGVASVGDLYDLAEISTNNYAINKYGWSDLRSAQVVRVRDGYMLKLPRALPLN